MREHLRVKAARDKLRRRGVEVDPPHGFVPVAVVADQVGYSVGSVRRAIREGWLPASDVWQRCVEGMYFGAQAGSVSGMGNEGTMSTPPAPQRAYHLTIDVGADTFADLIDLLHHIEYTLHAGSTNVTSGGYASGGMWHLAHDPAMTHDRYAAECTAWLAAREGLGAPMSSEPITNEELEQLEALCAAAPHQPQLYGIGPFYDAQVAFWATSRTALPKLIAECRSARALLAKADEVITLQEALDPHLRARASNRSSRTCPVTGRARRGELTASESATTCRRQRPSAGNPCADCPRSLHRSERCCRPRACPEGAEPTGVSH